MANRIQRHIENQRIEKLDKAQADVKKYGKGTVGGEAAAAKAKKLTRKIEGKPSKD